MLIDIHNHLIYGVDDGPREREESVALLKQAAEDCITAIIATPHKRYDMFDYPKEIIDRHFEDLKKVAKEFDIDLYVGCEYNVNSDMLEDIRSHQVHTLADTRYILCEYTYSAEYEYILKNTRACRSAGFYPVIAHVERYKCLRDDFTRCEELKENGAIIQINAGSVLGNEGHDIKKFTKNLLKNEIADIIASDTHGTDFRRNHLAECFRYVRRKYSDEYAEELFTINPGKILKEGGD